MRFRGNFRFILLPTLLLMLAGACAAPPAQAPEGNYYLMADMTYLRDAAVYDSNVVGQLYKGDRVERLEIRGSGWWQVRSGRTGQTGWVTAELFSPNPVSVPLFLVTQKVNLRECPREVCPSLQLLSRGDEVQKIEQNDQGWWRVLVAKSRNIGWLPANTLVASLAELQAQQEEKPYLYVAVRRLKLRRQPQYEAEAVKVLQVNDQVHKLEEKQPGWLKVRQPASGAVGWVPSRFLEALPVKYPRLERPRKKKPQPQIPKPAETGPKPPPPPEPEIM